MPSYELHRVTRVTGHHISMLILRAGKKPTARVGLCFFLRQHDWQLGQALSTIVLSSGPSGLHSAKVSKRLCLEWKPENQHWKLAAYSREPFFLCYCSALKCHEALIAIKDLLSFAGFQFFWSVRDVRMCRLWSIGWKPNGTAYISSPKLHCIRECFLV